MAEGRSTRLTPLHTAVPGRARFRVSGLRGDRSLGLSLESALPGLDGMRCASADIWTGSLLVYYDRAASLSAVVERIEQLLQRIGARQLHIRGAPSRTGDWHVMPASQALEQLGGSLLGLSSIRYEQRSQRYGPNVLPAIRSRTRMEILLEQFQTLPVALLIGASALSLLTGGFADAIAILSVVALNASIGYGAESQAERTIAALSKPLDRPVPVVREGKPARVPVESTVPGDLLELRPGVVVAADARVVRAGGLMVNEAMLTGESAPVLKTHEAMPKADLALADRTNMVYRGTIVTGGSGLAVAVATGARTEIGRIQTLVGAERAPETPLQRQLAGLGRRLTWVTGGACGLVLLIGLLRGAGLFQTLKNAIALGVAAVPEGFPALATTTLALGVERMRRGKVLVRRLEAVETLASVRVVCLDKTGTLTLNRMSVAEISCAGDVYRTVDGRLFEANGRPATLGRRGQLDRLIEAVALCNETVIARNDNGSELTGSSTESALVELALALGIDVTELRRRRPLLEVGYRTERRLFMTTLHEADEGRNFVAVKGSPEEVLTLCRTVQCGDGAEPLTPDLRRAVERENRRLTDDGQRVLGVAYALARRDQPLSAISCELTWLGLVGMADPLRPGVRELLKVFYGAGISPVMITGDQKGTAAAIARKLDLGNGELRIVDAAELEQFASMPELSAVPHVFARVTPAQKLQIVRALQGAGLVVAMTGDGINDSPALRAADIGVAMGRDGSDAAREVAQIVLENDDLISLLPAIQQGRTTYDNIRKAIRYLLATNTSEILVVLGATALGLGQPLAPSQLLWINLISDVFPALALGLEPPDPNVMRAAPRDPREEIVGWRDFRNLGREAAVMSAGALGAYVYGVARYGRTSRAHTICFASLVTAQLLHALTSRSRRRRAFADTLPPNRMLAGVIVASFLLQLAAMSFAPIRRLLRITPIGAVDAAVALAAGVAPFLVNEARKDSTAARRAPSAGEQVGSPALEDARRSFI